MGGKGKGASTSGGGKGYVNVRLDQDTANYLLHLLTTAMSGGSYKAGKGKK